MYAADGISSAHVPFDEKHCGKKYIDIEQNYRSFFYYFLTQLLTLLNFSEASGRKTWQ